jgi:enamine deaminase RidA (YjgF/YER057c/UK114 family)
MKKRRFVPFDMFAMRVDVPVSTMVRDGEYGWTCGQCPIDQNAAIVSPHDLFEQTHYVCDMIETVLPRASMNTRSIGKLNVYYVDNGNADLALDLIRQRFGPSLLIVPIAVPHFYYEGMMIEVDVFAGPKCQHKVLFDKNGLQIEKAFNNDMTLVYMSISNPNIKIEHALSVFKEHKLFPDNLLSDHWFLADPLFSSNNALNLIQDSGLMTNRDAVAKLADGTDRTLIAEFCFGNNPCDHTLQTSNDTVSIYRNKQDDILWVTGTCSDPTSDLVAQTAQIMSGINHSLIEAGATFENATKVTAHYVGGATEDELHENMKIRHSYYSNPGPASTGLPVEGLLGHGCQISIDVIATL